MSSYGLYVSLFFLLKPLVFMLCQTLSDAKKSGIKDQLQKLVSDWPSEVIKHQKEEDRKVSILNCEEKG